MTMAGAPHIVSLGSSASMFLKEPNIGKAVNIATEMAHLSDEENWAKRSDERAENFRNLFNQDQYILHPDTTAENLAAAERLEELQSTAQTIKPFRLDEKEEDILSDDDPMGDMEKILTGQKLPNEKEPIVKKTPTYGPYADQIKNLKV